MSRVPYTIEQLKKLGLVEKDGVYVKVSSLVAKPKDVAKISILETTEGVTYNPNKRINRVDPDLLLIIDKSGPAFDNQKLQRRINEIDAQSAFDKGNKKVRNATKSVVDGVKFDSNLEKTMYDLLTGAQIDFQFQKQYILQQKFRYGTAAIRAITLTVDFYLPERNMIIDTKGYANDVAPVKYKMLKKLLYFEYDNGWITSLPKIELPSTKKECEVLLNRLLYDK